ncbi:hypothetical protein [Massilia sp. TWR1-2-2]|uniref:hypothetical protein n=1 Tax=Massilia sp. TWR1-2-2 TaxID=2804584 RepID=UPI003CEC757C
MAYNIGMTEITLVLPFALPPPELAPDLIRALKAPALAALLSRTSTHQATTADPGARALPHELWLGRALGLSDGRKLAVAAAVMRAYGLDPADGAWFIVNPAHIEISRTFLMMTDSRRLGLVESHSRALFDSAKPYFEDSGHTLLYGDAMTWFMRADAWGALDTASADAATAMNLTDYMPLGERAIDYRKLQNEVQMLWHQHPANAEREARGFATINGFWPWGAAGAADAAETATELACADAPPWLAALASRHGASFAQLLAAPGKDVIFCDGSLAEAALATDWAGWLQHMQRLENDTFAPLLGALSGGVGRARLVLSHRTSLSELTTTRLAQRKFWRQPTLDRLLP